MKTRKDETMDARCVRCRRVTMVNGSYAIEHDFSLVRIDCIERVGVGIRYGFGGSNVIGEACGQMYLLPLTRNAAAAIKASAGVSKRCRTPGLYWSTLYVTRTDFDDMEA